jgi:hypothetical protein
MTYIVLELFQLIAVVKSAGPSDHRLGTCVCRVQKFVMMTLFVDKVCELTTVINRDNYVKFCISTHPKVLFLDTRKYSF